MPIKPENKALYPVNWNEISRSIREDRAGNQCEWIDPLTGARCQRKHYEPIPGKPSARTILTTAHLDHNPTNNDPENLRSWCQFHHLSYDAPMHALHAKETRRRKIYGLYAGNDLFSSVED